MKCKKCGGEIMPGGKFCNFCGAKVVNHKKSLIITVAAICAAVIVLSVIIPGINFGGSSGKIGVDIGKASVGDTVYFGAYEQDNNTENGKETVEWVVLDKKDDKILVISKYALACMRFNENSGNTTWEECTSRAWLNGTFFYSAFSAAEQEKIVTAKVDADDIPDRIVIPNREPVTAGNPTEDKIFLLSFPEAEKYFRDNSDRICSGTPYCNAAGALCDRSGNCIWWLRTPGMFQNYTLSVLSDGSLGTVGSDSNHRKFTLRPAMWINIE